MKLLPKWVLTTGLPAYRDAESSTALEQTYRVYKAMQELIAEYNTFAEGVNTTITEFINKYNGDMEIFTTSLRQEFQDFIDVIDLKISEINSDLESNVQALQVAIENGDIETYNTIATEFNAKLEELQTALNTMYGTLGDRATALEERTTALENRATDLENATEGLNSMYSTLGNDIVAVENRATALEERATALEEEINEVREYVDNKTASYRPLELEPLPIGTTLKVDAQAYFDYVNTNQAWDTETIFSAGDGPELLLYCAIQKDMSIKLSITENDGTQEIIEFTDSEGNVLRETYTLETNAFNSEKHAVNYISVENVVFVKE